MIKFFRRIRQKLLSENKFSKYLIYAIGEIILVVIGILIALQINNWNEDRKNKSEMSAIYNSVIDEMETDIATLDKILPIFQWKNRVIRRIINEGTTAEEWTLNDSLFASFVSFHDFGISQTRFDLLKKKVAYNVATEELNNRIAGFYQKHSVDIEMITIEANMSYHRNIEYWEENEPWFNEAIVDRDFSLLGDYAASSPIFRNKLAWYSIVLGRLEGGLRNYQIGAKDMSEKIREHLKDSR